MKRKLIRKLYRSFINNSNVNKDTTLIFEQYQLISEILSSKANIDRFKQAYGLGPTTAKVAFDRFNDVKDRLVNKNIFNYKSADELEAALRNAEGTSSKRTERRKKRQLRMADADRVYENDKVLVVSPLTYEASCDWGDATNWCSALRSNRSYFDQFKADNNILIYFIPKDKSVRKMALLASADSLPAMNGFDYQDKPVNSEAIMHQFDVDRRVVIKYVLDKTAAYEKAWLDDALKNNLPTEEIVYHLTKLNLTAPPDPGSALEKLVLADPLNPVIWAYAYDLVRRNKSLPRWYALEEAAMNELERLISFANKEMEIDSTYEEMEIDSTYVDTDDYRARHSDKAADKITGFLYAVRNNHSAIRDYIYQFNINEEDSWPRLQALLLDDRLWEYGSLEAAGRYAQSRIDKWPAYEKIMDRVVKGGPPRYPYNQYAETVYERYRDSFYPEERVQIPF